MDVLYTFAYARIVCENYVQQFSRAYQGVVDRAVGAFDRYGVHGVWRGYFSYWRSTKVERECVDSIQHAL